MKKTLLLTHEYYPFKGGVARYCYDLFRFFKKDEYLVITDNKEVKSKDNIINIKLTCKFLRPSWLFSYFKLKKIIKKNKIEQIFTPNILPLGSLAYFLKIPYIISLHGLDINLALKNKTSLTEKILKNAKIIITNTQNTADIIKPLDINQSKVHVIYPGIDFDTNYDEEKLKAFRKKLNISDEKIIISLGRLTKRKGQDLVIRALAEIKNNYKLKYFIIGRGEEKEYLESLIVKYELADNVFIFDDVEDEELIYFFKLADIFAMPHREIEEDIEGFGIVFLEAALNKLAIIAGDSGGVKEVFNNSHSSLSDEVARPHHSASSSWPRGSRTAEQAILVPSDDLRVLMKSIEYLLNNPQEAVKMAELAYKRAREFSSAQEQSLILKDLLK